MCDGFNIWALLVSLVGPLIAWQALRHAVKRADAALKEWRIQRLAERDADVAVKALQAALRYAAVIRDVSRGVTIGKDDRPADVKLADRWSIFDKLDNDFNDLAWLVRAQLGDKEAAAMDRLWNAKVALQVRQERHLSDSSMFEHAYGKTAFQEFEAAIVEIRQLLQPHIRMEAVKPQPALASGPIAGGRGAAR